MPPLVRPVRPMLATAGPPPPGAGWAFEFTWDGVRAVVDVTGVAMTVFSRNGNDVTASYPELAIVPERLSGRAAVLDGEIVTLDVNGRPSFTLLQQRMHVRVPSVPLLAEVPVQLYVFDILALGDRILTGEPYEKRREILDGLDLDDGDDSGGIVRVPPSLIDHPGTEVLHQAASNGLEGVVAKRLGSPYQPGVRSRDWVKTPLERTTEAIIVGWTRGGGRREGTIGALVLAAHNEQGRLAYLGNVGTGFNRATLNELQSQLAPLSRPAPALDGPLPPDAQWVEPVLVGEVAYRTLTPERRLRHPSWRGLRPDRAPDEVTINTAGPPGVM